MKRRSLSVDGGELPFGSFPQFDEICYWSSRIL